MIRVLIIGVGWWGHRLANTLVGDERFTISACYAKTRASAIAFASSYGASVVNNISAIPKSINLAVIATPNAFHYQLAMECLKQRIPCYIEKPGFLDLTDLFLAYRYSTMHKVPMWIGYNKKLHPSIAMARKWIQQNIDRIIHVNAIFANDTYLNEKAHSWRSSDRSCPLGPFTQLGVHHLDTLRYLFSDEVIVDRALFSAIESKSRVPSKVTCYGTLRQISCVIEASYESKVSEYRIDLQLPESTAYINERRFCAHDNDNADCYSDDHSLGAAFDIVAQELLNPNPVSLLSPLREVPILMTASLLKEKWNRVRIDGFKEG